MENADAVIASLQKYLEETKQQYETRKITAAQRIKEYDGTIEDPNSPPIEELRALVGRAIELYDLSQTASDMISMLFTSNVAISMRIFLNEVAYQFSLLEAQSRGHGTVTEETQKYAQLKKELQGLKRTVNREWKPIMEMLKEEVESRRKFLDENR
jgi:hypothetical protein